MAAANNESIRGVQCCHHTASWWMDQISLRMAATSFANSSMVRRLDASLMEDNDSSGTARVARASQQQLAALAQGDPHSFAGNGKSRKGPSVRNGSPVSGACRILIQETPVDLQSLFF